MRKQSILYKTLARALSIKRPHGGPAVEMFTKWLFGHTPVGVDAFFDECGNLHVDARVSPINRTLFVAHVDTVHREEGPNKIRKTNGMWYADGAPLGADDGAGCAMLMHLLCSGVPGYYVFTQGEECGGIGAKFLANSYASLLTQFDRAIAFDRRNTYSVITHQGWGRCCSDEFGNALADALNASNDSLMYMPDDTGVYTDTAEFVDLIPECTNISVGYDFEHSDREQLNIDHFIALSQAVLRVDWDGLPVSRDPLAPEPETYSTGVNSSWRSAFAWSEPDDWEREYLVDAIYDAQAGLPYALIDMICESVYPEDPRMAERFLNPRLLTEDLLDAAMQNSKTYDPDTVLCMLFDAIHCEA